MANYMKKIVGLALASTVVLGTAGVARAEGNGGTGSDTPTTTVAKGNKGKNKEYATKLAEYKKALRKFDNSKKAIQAGYVKAVKAATAAKKSALKAAKKNKAAQAAAKQAFAAAMTAAKDAKAAAITALGAPPTAPTAP